MTWAVRPYGRPLDADFCVAAWLRSWSRSRHGRALGAHVDHSPERDRFWVEHEPHVRRCLATEETRVLCKADAVDVIFAFACLGPGVVHYALAKTALHDQGLALDAFRLLLADRIEQEQLCTHEPRELRRAGLEPARWREDVYYWTRRTAA